MNLDFSEEQLMLRETSRNFLTDKFPKETVQELENSQTGYSPEIWREMAELGWMGLALPEKYGGSGMSFLDLAVVLEEMGRACMPGPFFSTVVLGALPIMALGSDEQKQRYLPGIAGGDTIFTLALTEDSAGYDASDIRVRATADGDGYLIEGTKLFVPDAGIADYLICAARTNDDPDPEKGITLFIVKTDSPGLKISPLITIAKDKLCQVQFDKVRVSRDQILGREHEAWPGLLKIIQTAATAKCCDMVGGLQKAFEITLGYAKERIAFGQPIGSFQAVQHHCANMAVDVNGAWLSAYQAAWKISEDQPCAWEVAVAKAWASRVSPRVIALAHQIHGAIGTTMDYGLHYYTRRMKAAESAFGGAEYYQSMVARELEKSIS